MDGALTLSFSRRITSALSGGISTKMIQRLESDPVFGKSEGTAYAVDLGFIYETPVRGLQAGCALLNTGTELRMSGEVKKDALPQTARVGLAYEYPLQKEVSLLLATDLSRILDGGWHPGFGAELDLNRIVSLRTGFYQKEGNISGSTYGLGVSVNNFRIDYSNVPASEMVGYTRNNKVSVTVQF
jgi:hypothetical protein